MLLAGGLQIVYASSRNVLVKGMPFVLTDQYGTQHAYHFPLARVGILLIADYDGSPDLEAWIRPLYVRYQQRVRLEGVAELSAVPGFMRGLVRAFFRSNVTYPVLLDWSGEVAQGYAYEKGAVNVFVLEHDGTICLRMIGAVTPQALQQVTEQIDHLLAASTHRAASVGCKKSIYNKYMPCAICTGRK
jgi:hypothetical protein